VAYTPAKKGATLSDGRREQCLPDTRGDTGRAETRVGRPHGARVLAGASTHSRHGAADRKQPRGAQLAHGRREQRRAARGASFVPGFRASAQRGEGGESAREGKRGGGKSPNARLAPLSPPAVAATARRTRRVPVIVLHRRSTSAAWWRGVVSTAIAVSDALISLSLVVALVAKGGASATTTTIARSGIIGSSSRAARRNEDEEETTNGCARVAARRRGSHAATATVAARSSTEEREGREVSAGDGCAGGGPFIEDK